MIQLNLLPDVKKEFIKAQKTRNKIIGVSIMVIIGSIGLTVLALVYVVGIQQIAIKLASDDIARKSRELQSIEDLGKYLTVQNQLQALPALHGNKTAYSRLFDALQQLIPSAPNNVGLTSIDAINEDKTIKLSGNAPTYEALNVFKDTLVNADVEYKLSGSDEVTKEKLFEAVEVQSLNLNRVNNSQVVSFDILVTYSEDVFKAGTKDVKVTVPNIQTTQSRLQSPQPVFNNGGGR